MKKDARILLVRPRQDENTKYPYPMDCDPPIFIGYTSTALRKRGFTNVHFLDGRIKNYTPYQAANHIHHINPSLIVIQTYIGCQKWTRSLVQHLYNIDRTYKECIVSVGPLTTVYQKTVLFYLNIRYGVVGEYEDAVADFAENGEALALLDTYSDKYPTEQHVDINNLPMQDWDILNLDEYQYLTYGATVPRRGKKVASLLVVRGCPYRCSFCFCDSVLLNRGRVKWRTAQSVVDEIEYLYCNHGVDEIVFTDDALNYDEKWLADVCDKIAALPFKIHWRSPKGLRADHLPYDLVEKMAKSGCYFVGIGVESGSKKVINDMNKRLDLEDVKRAVYTLHRHGILVQGFFMIGSPGETVEDIKESIRLSLEIPFDRLQVSNFVPYPGSRDFETITQGNKLFRYLFLSAEALPKYSPIELDEVYRMQRNWMIRFYARPRIIWSMLKRLTWKQVKCIWRHPWVRRWTKRSIQGTV